MGGLELPPVDVVVGIGRGGVVPAALAAQRLACDLRVLPVRFRDDAHKPERAEPLVTPPAFDVAGKRVLLVDDVARTGATLRAAAQVLAHRRHPHAGGRGQRRLRPVPGGLLHRLALAGRDAVTSRAATQDGRG